MTMGKYFLLSFDDGTIYDRRFVELLNKHDERDLRKALVNNMIFRFRYFLK